MFLASIRYFSRRDIHIVAGAGCPSLDRKVVNSGKRLRVHVGIDEGDVSVENDSLESNYFFLRTKM